MPKEIEENAIFIADAHYPHHKSRLVDILKKIEENKIEVSQLFLMGDIFDLLFGHNNYIQSFSKEAIELLNKLSTKLEIIYIEGNHDFCLKDIFPNISIYTREEQPIHFKLNKQDVYMSHGDKYVRGFIYNIYTKILRNKITLTLLKPFEKQIINHRIERLKRKKICGDFKGYKKRFSEIIKYYPENSIIIEGHFHQGIVYKNYISLPSFSCQNRVATIKSGEIIFISL